MASFWEKKKKKNCLGERKENKNSGSGFVSGSHKAVSLRPYAAEKHGAAAAESALGFSTLPLLPRAVHGSSWERDKINNMRGGLKAGPQSVADVFWRRNT